MPCFTILHARVSGMMACALTLPFFGMACIPEKICEETDPTCSLGAFLLYSQLAQSGAGDGGSEDPGDDRQPVPEIASEIYVAGSHDLSGGGSNFNWKIKRLNADGTEVLGGWDKSLDGPAGTNDNAYDVVAATDGGIFVGGELNDPSSSFDWSLQKFEADGTEVTLGWNKLQDGGSDAADRVYEMALTGNGEVYAAGLFETPSTDRDGYATKYQADGSHYTGLWNKTIDGGAAAVDRFEAVDVAPGGFVYIVGANRASGSFDWWIKKFDSDGTEITAGWNKVFDGGNSDIDIPYDCVVDSNGDLYVVGVRQDGGTPDWWLKKYSSDGTEITSGWNKQIDPAGGADEARAVALDSNDNVYVAGQVDNGGNFDWEIRKYAPDGTEDTGFRRSHDSGGADAPRDLALDGEGNIYIAGFETPGGSGRDWRVNKLNSDGSQASGWPYTYEGGSNGPDTARGITLR